MKDEYIKMMAAIVMDDIASYPMEIKEFVEDNAIDFDDFVLEVKKMAEKE